MAEPAAASADGPILEVDGLEVHYGHAHALQGVAGDGHGLMPVHGLMEQDGFDDLAADGEHRVEAGHRLLEDHGDLVAADPSHIRLGQLQQVGRAGRTGGGRGALVHRRPVALGAVGPPDVPSVVVARRRGHEAQDR